MQVTRTHPAPVSPPPVFTIELIFWEAEELKSYLHMAGGIAGELRARLIDLGV